MEITKVKIQHTLREGNNLADFVANTVIGEVGVVQFDTSISLPTKGRCILNMDKAQVPSLESELDQSTNNIVYRGVTEAIHSKIRHKVKAFA
ncbi:hypothetical protein KY284_029982 [Solanum tuberosum]|nr:hypothetical protein KY284_029982 [Solanum tuberosum]